MLTFRGAPSGKGAEAWRDNFFLKVGVVRIRVLVSKKYPIGKEGARARGPQIWAPGPKSRPKLRPMAPNLSPGPKILALGLDLGPGPRSDPYKKNTLRPLIFFILVLPVWAQTFGLLLATYLGPLAQTSQGKEHIHFFTNDTGHYSQRFHK